MEKTFTEESLFHTFFSKEKKERECSPLFHTGPSSWDGCFVSCLWCPHCHDGTDPEPWMVYGGPVCETYIVTVTALLGVGSAVGER
jgi:hypothetical protein